METLLLSGISCRKDGTHRPKCETVSTCSLRYRTTFECVAILIQEQKLTVKIIGVDKLKAMDKTGTSDPYVKITLLPVLPGKKREYTTTIKTKVLNASWNEEFHFEGNQEKSLHLSQN